MVIILHKGTHQQQWELLCGSCVTPGCHGETVYGVQVTCHRDAVWSWPDVSTDRETVLRLLEKLQLAQPEPCHWPEIIEDYIHELSFGGSPPLCTGK